MSERGLADPAPAVARDIPLPPVSEVAAGVWALPVPLIDNPLRYVVPYAIEVAAGLVLVDTGWNDEESWTALLAALDEIGAAPEDVRAVVVTHAHPDHYGLAPRMRERSGAWVGLHAGDRHLIADSAGAADAIIAEETEWLRAAGAPPDELDLWRNNRAAVHSALRIGPPDRFIAGGERIGVDGLDLVAVHTPGHTDGHLCFLDEKRRLLYSGDHVLPVISPNVMTLMSRSADPLGDFLDSLAAVRDLPVDRVLPAHVRLVDDLPARVDEIAEHHEQRLGEILAAVAAGVDTIWEIAVRQPWKRGWTGLSPPMRRAAVGETHAHLLLLERRGRIERGRSGVLTTWRVARTAATADRGH